MIKKKLNKNFSIIDNRIAQYKGLSFEARGLYFYMVSLPDGWDFSEERIAKNANIGLLKCKRILKELFIIGLLKREFTHNERGNRKSIYTLFDFSTIESPTFEKQMFENQMINKEINLQRNKDKKEINLNKKNIKKSFENQNIFSFCDLEAKNNDLKQKELKSDENIKQDNKNDLRGNYEALSTIQKRQVKKLEHLRELGFNKEPTSKNEIISYCEALYNANERLLFNIDAWLDWVEYKLSRDKKAIWTAYKANFEKLISFGNLAELSIRNSINSNWQGLFKPNGYETQEQNYSLRYQGDNKQNEDFIDELIKNGYYPSQEEREARERGGNEE